MPRPLKIKNQPTKSPIDKKNYPLFFTAILQENQNLKLCLTDTPHKQTNREITKMPLKLARIQEIVKHREASGKEYKTSVFSLLPRDIIANIVLPAKWEAEKEYRIWLDNLKIDIMIFQDARHDWKRGCSGMPRSIKSEQQMQVYMKSILNTQLRKTRRTHPAIRGKKTKK